MGKSTGERMQFEGFEYHVNGSGTVSMRRKLIRLPPQIMEQTYEFSASHASSCA